MHKSTPLDIIFQIIQFVVWELKRCERTLQTELSKGKFQSGVANSCKAYRDMYMLEWTRYLTLHKVEDWKFAIDHNFASHVRSLVIKEDTLPSYTTVKAHLDFSQFDLIHTLTLDCHNDVGHSTSLGLKGQWSYKKIIPNLPRRLKSLVILNAHGPDLQVIQKAIKQCSGLESLTLGRCTKFNRPAGCEFWRSFPNDHDSYFSGQGVDGYANALGTELQGLPNLKAIFVNVYLTDTKYLSEADPEAAASVVQAPQLPPESNPEIENRVSKDATNNTIGSQPPVSVGSGMMELEKRGTKCQDEKVTEEAENVAAKVLFDCHPALETAGFISYWSKDHLGWSIRKRREENDNKSPDHREEQDVVGTVELLQSI
ncbi:hypothetical protein RHS01_10733 [Rhizoctonia solani]|uniref:Uncharacterized protein n=1 Tax=Rhizoctonia solani TaxID=456999 RepID=A0A8H7LZL5_9AGAM|nr:hypothetical protein RHS01_10733 [Rhizoctonia solani]